MKGRLALVGLCLVLLLVVACAPKSEAVPSPASPKPASEEVAPAGPKAVVKEAWEVEWEKVMEAAKKEGGLVLFTTAGAEVRSALVVAFKARYGLQLEAVGARGGEITQKIMSERRAGLYLGDVYVGGTTTPTTELKPVGALDPLEPALILPDVTDPKVWWEGKLPWVDRDHYLLSITLYPSTTYAINTNLVKAEELKSYRDLLNPKWKGKMVMNDPSIPGSANRWFGGVSQSMGLDFMRELAKQEPLIIRDQRLQVEWLAHGKYLVAVAPDTAPMASFKEAGAPVSYITPVEGSIMTSGHGNVSLVNKAPRPNASRVFINWLLTKEGQAVFSRATQNPSTRVDVSEEYVDPAKRRVPGVKYYNSENEEFLLAGPDRMKVAREIFGHLIK